jgi:hypothetical protein
VATSAEYLNQPVQQRLERLARTPDEVADAIRGCDEVGVSRRSDPAAWSAKDVVCHLRDIEELVICRFHSMLAMEDPSVLVVGAPPSDPATWHFGDEAPYPMDADRWRDERQYARNDAPEALAAFRRRRREVLALLGSLTGQEWQRGAIHPSRGRLTFGEWLAGMAAHDDAHLDQLRQALV